MESITRKPLQGIKNIIRFNWHFYLFAVVIVIVLLYCATMMPGGYRFALMVIIALTLISTFTSLIVSWYIYDHSNIYTLNWLNSINIEPGKNMVNINAGLDETSYILSQKYKPLNLTILDFYDPEKHTEISIARARRAYPAYPGTVSVATSNLQLAANSIDYAFLLFAAHEIRDSGERIDFFRHLNQSLAPDGRVVILEHLRDTVNFMAYNMGYNHFYSQKSWVATFKKAGLNIETELKVTPFLTAFVLQKNGTAS